MKIAITGHSAGIGQALATIYANQVCLPVSNNSYGSDLQVLRSTPFIVGGVILANRQ